MTTEEILKAATPRPWKNTSAIPDDPEQSTLGWTGTPPFQMDADDALAELAVNAYESDRAKIKALVLALQLISDGESCQCSLTIRERKIHDEAVCIADAALKLAGGE